MPGKISASLNERLKKVEWGEYRLMDLFDVSSSKKIFHANNVIIYPEQIEGSYPYIVRATTKNGQRGYIKAENNEVNEGNSLSFAQDTFTVFYQKDKFVTGNKVKVLRPRFKYLNCVNANFIISAINHSISHLSWGVGSDVKMIESIEFQLPIKNGKIDFEFMEKFIIDMEEEHIAQLKNENAIEKSAYLMASELKDYQLTDDEKKAIDCYNKWEWDNYNLEDLFGKSTRGKRLKSADRELGELPFVTAGEAREGISDFIGNKVHVFSKNTITIDMFGSAKYRKYEYGGDDHIAVVHTEKLPMNAVIFITAAIHKSSHNGQFDYSRNFYAKDADELYISLPKKDGKPDFNSMITFISAIHKLVIKDIASSADNTINATRKIIEIHRREIES